MALAVANDDPQRPGTVAFFDTDGNPQTSVSVGALPDQLTFTPDGRFVLVANENEPDDDFVIDPVGSVSVIDTQDFTARIAAFDAFNDAAATLVAAGVRVFGPGASVAQDLEPEFIAVTPDSTTAFVALQENNALAVLDVASAAVTDVLPLGTVDHARPGRGIDVSDDDGSIDIRPRPVSGLRLPDAIATYEVDGRTFVVTANEGDGRDFDGFSEVARVADLTLDPAAFPDAATLQNDAELGRLEVTTTLGDTDGDGDFDGLFSFGTRSFSIFEVTGENGDRTLTEVFDSGDDFERLIADRLPRAFGSDNDDNDSFDRRSDDGGPEPEGVTLGTVGGRTYAFIGLERVGGVAVYDVTDPEKPSFVAYENERDFGVTQLVPDDGTFNPLAGDLGPEGLLLIPAADSPNGQNLLVVANEVSGSTRIFGVTADGDAAPQVISTPTAAAAGVVLLGGLLRRRR